MSANERTWLPEPFQRLKAPATARGDGWRTKSAAHAHSGRGEGHVLGFKHPEQPEGAQ